MCNVCILLELIKNTFLLYSIYTRHGKVDKSLNLFVNPLYVVTSVVEPLGWMKQIKCQHWAVDWGKGMMFGLNLSYLSEVFIISSYVFTALVLALLFSAVFYRFIPYRSMAHFTILTLSVVRHLNVVTTLFLFIWKCLFKLCMCISLGLFKS